MIKDKIIKDFSNEVYQSDEFLEIIKRYDEDNYEFYIGTDSQILKNKINIVTCLCLRKFENGIGKSGKVFYFKEKMSRRDHPNLRSRMLLEAYRSLELAQEIEPIISNKIFIHLDIGSTYRSRTSNYEKEITGIVTMQGFSCEIKPNSWAAAGVADRVSKY